MLRKIFPFVPLLLLILFMASADTSGGAAPPPKPLNALVKPTYISCQGFKRDTVFIYWQDQSTDENNYRVYRSIGGAAWKEIATVTPNSTGHYGGYSDNNANVSQPNRRYRVRAYRASDNSYGPYSDICTNRRIYDPGGFFIFYGLLGTTDKCPPMDGQPVCLTNSNDSSGNNVFASQLNEVLAGSAAGFTRVGFDRDVTTPNGTPAKVPINATHCDGGGCAYYDSVALAPAMLETPFDLNTRVGIPVAYMVPMHELFHYQQYHYYPGLNDPSENWVYEGQARSIQDKICIGANRSTANCFDDIQVGGGSYVGQVQAYLGHTNWPLIQHSYSTALFWTYLTEKYGTSPSNDTAEGGMNLMAEFWKEAAANPNRDGIAVLNSTLTTLGHTERFRDIWKDFAVANYAKDLSGSGVPAKYQYADMAQPGGNYGPVQLSLNKALALDQSAVDPDESVYAWGARYYQVRPAAGVPTIAISVTQSSTAQLYYTVLGIKGNNLAYQHNVEGRHLAHTVTNNGYDKVVLIVAGLDKLANFRYAINSNQPSLHILNPTVYNPARVGSHSNPDKLRVMVDLLQPDGTPMPGANLSDFDFKVGSKDVPDSKILASTTVMGQHWFLLRPPKQSAAGLYDLQVSYSQVVTDNQTQAVNYAPRIDADNLLLIDKSGSMGSLGKMEGAKGAARLFVDSWQSGDKIGVISFNHNPSLDMSLTNWNSSSRQTAINAINVLSAGGGTNIGDTLRAGWNELSAKGNSAHDWTLVLLSDGKEESSSPTESFEHMINDLFTATGKRPVVHAVAVGADADRPRMQRVALVSGGSYQYVSLTSYPANSVKLNMDYRYRTVAAETLGLQPFYGMVGPLSDGIPGVDNVPFLVERGAADMTLSLSWEGLGWEGILKNPDDETVDPFQVDSEHHHIMWRVADPEAGIWNLEVTPAEAEYLVAANLRSDLTMEVYLTTPVKDRTPGVPMPIVAALSDTGPILGATVYALVETPGGSQFYLQLLDDGAHQDGAADDGLYGTTFYQTGDPGSYTVLVSAVGSSTVHGNFMRQRITAFHLTSAADYPEEMGSDDWDGDGMCNEWEQRYQRCVDPLTPDDGADPDQDGVSNTDERAAGTDPCSDDSDSGGEADGSDPNPHDPEDDAVQPGWAVAHPGIGRIFIKYAPQPGYDEIEVLVGGSRDGLFEPFDHYPVEGSRVITIPGLVNGQTYCYSLVGIDGGRRSAGSDPSCATPKTDPYPPHGTVSIEGGAGIAGSLKVTLDLWASDAVDPALVPPGSRDLLPPEDSASGVTDMMISNRSDFKGAAWKAYKPSKAWELEPEAGLAAVFVKYRDAAGNESEPALATISIVPRRYLPLIMRH